MPILVEVRKYLDPVKYCHIVTSVDNVGIALGFCMFFLFVCFNLRKNINTDGKSLVGVAFFTFSGCCESVSFISGVIHLVPNSLPWGK